jgi:uncharacterized membrane protein
MTARTLGILRAIIGVTLGAVAGWSVARGNFITLIIAFVLAITLIFFFNRATREVTQDERTRLLKARASRAAVMLLVPAAALISVALIALQNHLSHDVVVAAYTLSYSCCAILLAHAAFYIYFGSKN